MSRAKKAYCTGGVVRIPNYALAEGYYEEVVLPSTLVEIGKRAFENCENLSKINRPQSLLIIGEDAFYNCPGLTR
jgi:hypothetical protein